MSIKNKILSSYIVVFMAVFFLFFYYNRFEEKTLGCGTPDIYYGIEYNIEATEGRKLFKSLCASCHKLDKKLIGPALRGLKMDSLFFYNYINSKREIHQPNFTQLTIKNTNDIIKYLKN